MDLFSVTRISYLRSPMSFNSLAQIMTLLRNRYPALGNRWDEAQQLAQWEKAVGPGIAKHAKALRVEEGVLWVEVDHPLWKAEIHNRRGQILEKLKNLADAPKEVTITDIRCMDTRR